MPSRLTTLAALATLTLTAAAQTPEPTELHSARVALAEKHFPQARTLFTAYLHAHPNSIEAELGIADSDLGLHAYSLAELQYRRVVAVQPQLWPAHKNLIIVEAALGRWEEFDNERNLLRLARQRGAPGISARESDVIDTLDIPATPATPARPAHPAQHWIVREYYEPAGRSLTRFNFELFSPDGRVSEYISLESTEAAQAALARNDTQIGTSAPAPITDDFALNFYTGKSHGNIKRYPHGEPAYERVRADVIRWLRTTSAPSTSPSTTPSNASR